MPHLLTSSNPFEAELKKRKMFGQMQRLSGRRLREFITERRGKKKKPAIRASLLARM